MKKGAAEAGRLNRYGRSATAYHFKLSVARGLGQEAPSCASEASAGRLRYRRGYGGSIRPSTGSRTAQGRRTRPYAAASS